MRAKKWLKWFCVGLLAAGCALTIGCSDDDDDDDAVAPPADTPVTLVAPQLVTPADDMVYTTLLAVGTLYPINYEWTAVPGAASYVLEVDGVQSAVAGTAVTKEYTYGDYEWRVWAKDANGASGPASAKSSFEIRSRIVIPGL